MRTRARKKRSPAWELPLCVINYPHSCSEKVISENSGKFALGVIAFDEDIDTLVKLGLKRESVLSLGAKNDVSAHASRLFSILRECDTCGFEKIYARLPDKDGLSLAVYNRIIKAAGYDVIRGAKEE